MDLSRQQKLLRNRNETKKIMTAFQIVRNQHSLNLQSTVAYFGNLIVLYKLHVGLFSYSSYMFVYRRFERWTS
jgi:hypothetical protein